MSNFEKQSFSDKNLIDSFSKYAKSYDRYAQLQKSMAERLASYLPIKLPQKVLEIGCGTGLFTKHILTQNPSTNELTLNDIAPGMLGQIENTFSLPKNTIICPGNAEYIRFNKADLICANAVFQWFQYPSQTLKNLNEALENHGNLIFSTFGPRTLNEFREATKLRNPTKLFDDKAWVKMIKESDFVVKAFDKEVRKIFFSSSLTLLKNLQQIGATPFRMVKTGGLRQLMKEYDSRFSTPQGVYATWELYYFSLVQKSI